MEDNIFELMELCMGVLSDYPLFVAVNSYTTGVSPSVMEYMLGTMMKEKYKGTVDSQEIGLTCKAPVWLCPAAAPHFGKKRVIDYGNKELKAENVWFRYSEDGDWALKGINVEIKKGEFVAILGSNGWPQIHPCKTF